MQTSPGALQRALSTTPLPRLRLRRRAWRPALRRGQERDRDRGPESPTAWASATNAPRSPDHARPGRDDAPRRRPGRRSPAPYSGLGRPGRPGRNMHLPPLSRNRAAGRAPGPRHSPRRRRTRSRHGRRRPPHSAGPGKPSPAKPESTCRITDAVCSVIAGTSIPEALAILLARAAPARRVLAREARQTGGVGQEGPGSARRGQAPPGGVRPQVKPPR